MKPRLLLLVVPFVVAGMLQGCLGSFGKKEGSRPTHSCCDPNNSKYFSCSDPYTSKYLKEPDCPGYILPIFLGSLAVGLGVGSGLILGVLAPDASDTCKGWFCTSPRTGANIFGVIVAILSGAVALTAIFTLPEAIKCSDKWDEYDNWLSGLSPEDLENYKVEKKEALQRERCSSLQKTVEGLGTRYDLKRYYSECRKFINSFDFHSRTKLHLAVKEGSLKKTKLYLSIGAKINLWARDIYGWTPLHYAASIDSEDIVDILLQKGADPKIKDNEGKTPLDIAVEKGHAAIVEVLVKGGAEINKRMPSGMTPFYFAFINGRKEIVKFLIAHGADVNARPESGETLLHWSARNGFVEAAELLVNNGADPTIKDNQGKTPLDIAVENGHEEVVKLLRKAAGGLDPEIRPK